MIDKQKVQDQAEANFKKKEQRAQEGAKAYAEYLAEGNAIQQKTARLKAARLAKEAAELELKRKTELEPKGKKKKSS